MIPYTRHQITEDDRDAVMSVLSHGWNLTQGEFTLELERRLREETGAKHAIVVSSGTAALHLAYMAADQQYYDVHVPTITFMATANVAYHCSRALGSYHVNFVDCDPHTGLGIFTEGMQFIVPVWLGGRYHAIPDTVLESNPTVIVDAAQGMGNPMMRQAVRESTAICLSFHATKQVAAGEGGAILTNDEDIARKCRALRDHGREEGYMPVDIGPGFNYRITEMGAALACSQLDRLPETYAERLRLRDIYAGEFKGKLEWLCDGAMHLFQITTANVRQRDFIRIDCRVAGIETQAHYFPVHRQPWWQRESPGEALPWGQRFYGRTLSIPFYPGLTEDEQEHVIQTILGAL